MSRGPGREGQQGARAGAELGGQGAHLSPLLTEDGPAPTHPRWPLGALVPIRPERSRRDGDESASSV